MTLSMDKFRETYITECFELLSDMEERLLSLDPDAADMEQLNAIFRCAHSIKGGSGAFGLSYITHFTHTLEALLDMLRESKIRPTREVVDTLLKSVDIVTQMVRAAQAGETPPATLGAEVFAQLQAFANSGGDAAPAVAAAPVKAAAAAAQDRSFVIHFKPHETLFSTGNEPLLILRELLRLGPAQITPGVDTLPPLDALKPDLALLGWAIRLTTDKGEEAVREAFEFVTDHCDLSITEAAADTPVVSAQTSAKTADPAAPAAGAAPAEAQGGTRAAAGVTSIRVDISKIDRLVNMVGELVITEAMLKAQTREFPVEKFAGLIRGIEDLSQHARELQEAVMSVRMQPVKSIFSRMPRIVHDLSLQLSKDIRLVTHGENTEVDKTVIEQLSDPLTHMIRNSVDHGIEKPETRTAAGKPAQGTIHLSADHRGGRIIIEIRDDGAGINREKVLKKAREKGLIAEDAVLSNEECDNLIFRAGFSTADVVSNVSGRGVGMDVVKRNIEGMGGTVKVTTEPGKGSVFTVSLPLTLAILDGMIVRVGVEHYIIPITSIIETMRPKASEVHHVEGHSDVINVRGEFISLVHLHRVFDISDAQDDPSKALVVLVESGREKMGLVVDELIGQQQVVIKSLAANADPVQGISGATILGDGRVSLILEINELWQIHSAKGQDKERAVA